MVTSSHRLDSLELLRIDYCPSPAEIARAWASYAKGGRPASLAGAAWDGTSMVGTTPTSHGTHR